MQSPGRFFLALISLALSYFLVARIAFSLFAPGAPAAFRAVTGLACGTLVAIAIWRAAAGAPAGLGGAMLKGAGLLGVPAFLAGFVGPMLFTPEANQGPLLGIFITGPIGALIGAVAGAIWWQRKPRSG